MATIKDVARLAGVSNSTVSRVINESGYVSAEKRELVLKAMKELNFKPNHLARGLVAGKTQTVGLLVPDITNHFFSDVSRGIEDSAISLGFCVVLCNFDWKIEREQMYLSLLKSKQVDGVIVVGSQSNEKILLEELEPFPFVVVDRKLTAVGNYVWTNHEKGARKAVEHLIEIGCERIVHLAGPSRSFSAIERKKGYEAVMREKNLPIRIIPGDFRYFSGFEIGMQLFKKKTLPDGIFAANDLMAIGLIQAANRLGIKIPDQVCIVGYDNIDTAEYIYPSLTTIHQPAYDMGKSAFQMLYRKMNNKDSAGSETVEFDPILIRRNSTRKIINL